MIGEKLAGRLVACGVIAALIAGVLTAYFALMGRAGLSKLNLVDATIFLVLALGISRKSRVAAVLALAYDGVNQVVRFEQQGIIRFRNRAGDRFRWSLRAERHRDVRLALRYERNK